MTFVPKCSAVCGLAFKVHVDVCECFPSILTIIYALENNDIYMYSFINCITGEEKVQTVKVTKEAEYCRLGKQSYIITEEQKSTHFKFNSIHSK